MSGLGSAQTRLRVAAAADLGPPLKEIAERFRTTEEVETEVVLGSSGNLYAQVRNGAPFDVFLSADEQYITLLEKDGFASGKVVYARGTLAVVGPGIHGHAAVTAGLFTAQANGRIAIANPQHAPYGRAAMSLLKHLGIVEEVKPRLVRAENVAQTVQFVDSGNAELGIVALSLVIQRKERQGYLVPPPDAYPPIIQAGAAIAHREHMGSARRFLAFMRSPAAQQILRRYGFQVD